MYAENWDFSIFGVPGGHFTPLGVPKMTKIADFSKKNLKKIGQKFKMSKNEQIWREAQVPERLKTTSI